MIQDVTAESCVAFALKTEEMGAELYQGLARKFAADVELRDLFERLAAEEVDHAEQIRTMGERLVPRLRDRPLSAEEQDYLRAMTMSDIFSRAWGPAVDIGNVRTREDALKRALQLEKTTLAYYQAVRDVVGSEAVLDSLIAMERKHVAKVMALLVGEMMLRGLADSAG
ncbi:MAG TPA: ferritin family protein [Anaeromyxobacteraceae bacterium]|nr:ferritin family protein [Anaeromyxobacteraceae bacterium]